MAASSCSISGSLAAEPEVAGRREVEDRPIVGIFLVGEAFCLKINEFEWLEYIIID